MAAISDFEHQRILEIIAAVGANDWGRFKFLSDDPFLNEESMFEQFEGSRLKVVDGFGDWQRSAAAELCEDGARMIHLPIQAKIPGDPEILLTLHSSRNRISIWVFCQIPDFSN
ncbi:MAG TPA: hypothetical protein VGV39_18060 [Mesorhizobium sp.]|jgi:hypothetical protein|uniref:hypothetical protein n=1 Tax=Mesorhizobium sp. TaxID=1871066 RepID=UPI002DDD1820|nr:hypothetical protein [Mesorhizobium sp.]HEV2504987.1 hypothetical protein [Mesorhizobium sp.]